MLALWAGPALRTGSARRCGGSRRWTTPVIVVTGSRVRTDGMQAPVPLTVVSADEVEALSPGALISGVSQLPQFYGNQTPNSGAFFTRAGYGSLNMRGLGVNRTLTLLNGRRMPSTSAFGGVDINLFPEAMLSSVETTTGGASAAYGSDAVAGVVNFILDTDFTGLEVSAQVRRYRPRRRRQLRALGRLRHAVRGRTRACPAFRASITTRRASTATRAATGTRRWSYLRRRHPGQPVQVRAEHDLEQRHARRPDQLARTPRSTAGASIPTASVGPGVTGSIAQGGVGTPGARMAGTGIPGTAAYSDNAREVLTLYPDLDRYSLFGYVDYDVTDRSSPCSPSTCTGAPTSSSTTIRAGPSACRRPR